jgi:DNA-binding response OmpR family regulator
MTAKRILIVEDDPYIQDIFTIIFKSYGYTVECIDNGRALCERNGNWPDAIILDKQLPGVNGIDACRALKSKEETKEIPIIMISASSGVEAAAIKAGADDFLEKPFNMHIILNKVFTLIKKRTIHS